MSLNDSKIRTLKPSSRPVKLSDSHGLYLLVNPGGSRIWYLKYRFNGKESRVSLGAYPLVSLAEARQQRDGIRKLLAQNINPAQHLDGVVASPVKNHYPALPLERLPELLDRIGDYRQGRELTRLAVVLTLHLFIRSSELRFARWSEIDFRHKIWTIPATREAIDKVRFSDRGAKMRSPHIVPLSRQAIAILKQIQELSGHLDLVFPGDHNPYKPMSENTTNRALRLMGYDTKTEICGHGLRAMACSALVESDLWSRDTVERQMSHQERNSVRAAYVHKAEHLEARKAMMQWWSDYLDVCREGYVAPYIYARQHKAA
ncbi:site-specific integrase [Escherichia albertii]|uniref:tyrosine-type recombinase/integrase n=1 Tax=Escherichia albertii TaxID=208962 RepID=UPI001F2439C7|nr:site-specific integrase [Escherichia albertii]MCE7722585.1 site-specific integrase [Escherichia albertii]MCE7726935.1 site-specific integrase [Escherichia albertii]